MPELAIRAEQLTKTFGGRPVLRALDLEVPQGVIFGLLGPNGAGKATAVRILTTLLRPDSGRAFVLGHDVVTRASRVRPVIGLTGQYAAVDDLISARQNLYLIGRLTGLAPRPARARVAELLAVFGLEKAAATKVKNYSGGMRRRLDLAASLVGRPAVLFLDEPTTGPDLASRNQLWDLIRALAADGTTVLLTTQYLEEADRLAGRVMVIDHGACVALGTPGELESMAGGLVLEVRPLHPADAAEAGRVLAGLTGVTGQESGCRPGGGVRTEGDLLTLHVPDEAMVTVAARRLDAAGLPVRHLAVRTPGLDEAFLVITGHHAGAQPGGPAQQGGTEPGGTEPGGTEPGGTELGGTEPDGAGR